MIYSKLPEWVPSRVCSGSRATPANGERNKFQSLIIAQAGSGEIEPTAGSTTVHGRALNRRVKVFLTHQL